jgi:hypothetical protein
MKTQKYAVNQHLIATLLAWVKCGEIAIPEIQRPFVWDSPKGVNPKGASGVRCMTNSTCLRN